MTRNGRYRSSRPRRARYQASGVTFIESRNVWRNGTATIMAYGVEDAERTLRYNGLQAGFIEKYRRPVQRGGGYRLDAEAVEEAKRYFGLVLPVRIRYSSRAGNTRGNYRLSVDVPDGNFHNVMLKTYLDPEQASRTLWHELTHAMQAEREARAAGYDPDDVFALDAWRGSPARGRGTRYLDKPIEVEAREHEALHESLPLTRAQ